MTRPRLRGPAAAALAALLAGCAGAGSGASGSPTGGSGAATPAAATGHVTVFAASSLTDAFGAEGAAFTRATGRRVTFSFAGSQDLAAQLRNGAPADVLATADQATMRSVAGRLAGPARTFARNRLVIVVARGDPKHVRSLADLARRDLAVVLADPSVPAGAYAARALAAAHVSVHPRSLELDVRSVLTKVELGEADAGIVYVTDAAAAHGRVGTVPVPDSPVATYPIAPVTRAGRPFVAFVLSPVGQRILHRFGFARP
jgi:molybdate transport system substrate-binding protein